MTIIKALYKIYRLIFAYHHSSRPVRAILLLKNHIIGNVLDAGCGDGRNLIFLEKLADKVIGIDFDSTKILALKNLNKSVIKYDLNNVPLPFRDNYFDAILCSHVLEHISSPDSVIEDFTRICCPFGLIIIAVPNVDCLYHNFYDLKKHPGHINKMKKHQWERILQDKGLFIIRRVSNFPFFWNITWGRFINILPIKNYLSDIWFICKNVK